jgi:hypothetical protein
MPKIPIKIFMACGVIVGVHLSLPLMWENTQWRSYNGKVGRARNRENKIN